MGILKGTDGSCKVDGTTLNVTAWSLSVAANEAETTNVGDKDQTFEQTTRSGEGNMTVNFDPTDAKQKTICDMWLSGNSLRKLWLQFYVDATRQWSFSAIITGFDNPVGANDIDMLTVNIKRSGAFFAVPTT